MTDRLTEILEKFAAQELTHSSVREALEAIVEAMPKPCLACEGQGTVPETEWMEGTTFVSSVVPREAICGACRGSGWARPDVKPRKTATQLIEDMAERMTAGGNDGQADAG